MTKPDTPPFSPTLDDLSEALGQDVFGSDDPIVVAIKGGWGEGKTFFWKNSVVPQHAAKKPGYVSVFGKDSLAAIQREVAVEALRTQVVRTELFERIRTSFPALKALGGLAKRGLDTVGVSLDKLGVSDVLNALPEILERVAIRPGWVLCLDDVERLSASVGLDALFGYVNSLRDDRRINIVLIYNEERVEGEQQVNALKRYAEKVVDREFSFKPDLQEIVKLVFGSEFDQPMIADVVEKSAALGLRNIRILKRLKRYDQQFKTVFESPPDSAYLNAATLSLLLFCWMRFAPADSRDLTFDFLEEYSGGWTPSGDEEEATDWRVELLKKFGYTVTDDLDRLLMQFVRTNIPDKTALQKNFEDYLAGDRAKQANDRLEQAWLKYFHGTLEDREAEFCDAIFAAAKDGMKHISLGNIDAVLVKLELFDCGEQAQLLLEQLRREQPPAIEKFEDLWGPLKHPGLRTLVEQTKARASEDNRSLAEMLENLPGDFLQLRDRQRLAQFEPEQYLAYFTATPIGRVTGRMRHLVQLASVGGGDEFDAKILRDMTEVVRAVAATNRINRARMESMGLLALIGPDEPPT